MPGQAYSTALSAAVLGQLGDTEAARSGVRDLLALQPDFARTARAQFGKWYLPGLVEHLIDMMLPSRFWGAATARCSHAPAVAGRPPNPGPPARRRRRWRHNPWHDA